VVEVGRVELPSCTSNSTASTCLAGWNGPAPITGVHSQAHFSPVLAIGLLSTSVGPSPLAADGPEEESY
jgi:hypothetical protein